MRLSVQKPIQAQRPAPAPAKSSNALGWKQGRSFEAGEQDFFGESYSSREAASSSREAAQFSDETRKARPPLPSLDSGRILVHPLTMSGVQTKLAINRPGDEYEQQADRMAYEVMRVPPTETPWAPKKAGPSLQRQCACGGTCADCQKQDEEDGPVRVQRKEAVASRSHEAGTAPPMVDAVLRSSGRPLDLKTRSLMEPRFGFDFGSVRIHTDALAGQSARALNAHAYTVGHHVAFDTGRYAPGTPSGGLLLAHELTHVVQQSQGGMAIQRAPNGRAEPMQPLQGKSPMAPMGADGLGLSADSLEVKHSGLRIATYEQIEADVKLSIRSPSMDLGQGRADANRDIRIAMAGMSESHRRTARERLSYARGVLEVASQMDGSKAPTGDELSPALINFEVNYQRGRVDLIVHTPMTADEKHQYERILAERERQKKQDERDKARKERRKQRELEKKQKEFYLGEVKRLEEARKQQAGAGAQVSRGPKTVSVHQEQIFGPGEDLGRWAAHKFDFLDPTEWFTADAVASLVSNALNFIPVVGQLKMAAEAIWGKDLITGEHLEAWQRGLNLLLIMLPEAKSFMGGGDSGLTHLAETTVAENQSLRAEEVFRTSKATSRLTEEEISAAEKIEAHARPTPDQMKIIRCVDEIGGTKTALGIKAPAAAESLVESGVAREVNSLTPEVARIKEPVTLKGGGNHTLSLRQVGNEVRCVMCSPPPCGELIEKVKGMLEKLPPEHGARAELEALQQLIQDDATWVNVAPDSQEAASVLKDLKESLGDIQTRYPDVVVPEGPVPAEPVSASGPATKKVARYDVKKPKYENPGHHEKGGGFRGGGSRTTLLPLDAEDVYANAVPGDATNKNWWGMNSKGDIYRYFNDGNGNAHFSGSTNSPDGLDVPTYVRKRLGVK